MPESFLYGLFLFRPYRITWVRQVAKKANCVRHSSRTDFLPICKNSLTKMKSSLTNFCLMVDEKKIALNPAYELSFLKPKEQEMLMETMDYEQATPSLSQAQRMKKFSQDGKLSEDVILTIIVCRN